MPANLENSAVATGLKKVSFHSNRKERQGQKGSNYHTITLISHASKVMLKILQPRLQQNMNHELADVPARFKKGRGARDQIANICWIIEKAREFQKNIYFCFIDYAKAFDCVEHNKLWKALKKTGIPDHFTCLLKNLYAGQEATVRILLKVVQNWERSVYCHPVYLTYIHSTSCEMLGWMNYMLESRLLGKISTTSDMQMMPF